MSDSDKVRWKATNMIATQILFHMTRTPRAFRRGPVKPLLIRHLVLVPTDEPHKIVLSIPLLNEIPLVRIFVRCKVFQHHLFTVRDDAWGDWAMPDGYFSRWAHPLEVAHTMFVDRTHKR